jgi:pimeloyl-ACP methyl ester carboxylesterase
MPLPIRAWFPGSVEKEVLDDYLGLAFDRASLSVALALMGAGPRAALRSHDGSIDYGMAFEHMDKPLLVVAGTHDSLAPIESVRPAFDQSRSRDKTWRVFPLGHIDLVVGREAPRTVWPLCSGWMAKR